MTKVNIDTGALKYNVDVSLNEIKNNLIDIEKSAQGINTPLSFVGSEKIASISQKISNCIAGINNTIEWYNNTSDNYDHFSNDAISDINLLETYQFKSKDFDIKK